MCTRHATLFSFPSHHQCPPHCSIACHRQGETRFSSSSARKAARARKVLCIFMYGRGRRKVVVGVNSGSSARSPIKQSFALPNGLGPLGRQAARSSFGCSMLPCAIAPHQFRDIFVSGRALRRLFVRLRRGHRLPGYQLLSVLQQSSSI
jgi:hypothetical protein